MTQRALLFVNREHVKPIRLVVAHDQPASGRVDDEAARKRAARRLMPERVGHEAAALLDRLMAGEAAPAEPITIPPRGVTCRQSSDILAIDDASVLKAARFIRAHAHEPIQVNDVVEQVGISRRSLERRFIGVLGRSLHTEIRRAHIDRAKKLLIETRLSVNEVAASSGFTNATHLGVAFREQTGMTPGQYRRNDGTQTA